jgi:type II secretory pathway component GspD/PulD (secretin)
MTKLTTKAPVSIFREMKKGVGLALCLSLFGQGFWPVLPLQAQAAVPDRLTGDVSVMVNPVHLRQTLPIAGAGRVVNMSLRGVPLADALCALAKKGGFNIVVDESVQGTVNTDLNNVTIQNALETLKTFGNLTYSVQGGTLAVATADSARGLSFRKSTSRIFRLKNANAQVIADFLNRTVFGDRNPALASSGGGSGGGASNITGLTVTPDPQTNSVLVVGTPTDISTVEEHLEVLDKPRQRRTWRLSHSNVLDVATILASSVFNEGQPVLITGSGSNSTSGSGSGPQMGVPTSVRTVVDNIAEGSGSGQAQQNNSSGGGGGGAGASGSTTFNGNLLLRGRAKQMQTVQVSPNGPILIPDTRLNTLTLLGTAEQIALVESFLPTLDRKMPQVVLEASLVEISEDGRRELGHSLGANAGSFSAGTNNIGRGTAGGALVNQAYSNNVGRINSSDTPLENVLSFTSNPLRGTRDFVYQINLLVSKNKAKLLANPTVIATSDNETLISIVDEVIRSVTVTVGTNNGPGSIPTVTNNIGEAGIVLNILPRVGPDGTVALRVRPIVSSVSNIQQDRFGNLVTLLSKREVLSQNSVLRDGETFVLGGLLQDTNAEQVARNPILASLPIIGALARNSVTQKKRTELVILITPHILTDDADPVATRQGMPTTASSITSGGILPVSVSGPLSGKIALPPLEKIETIPDVNVRKAAMQESNYTMPLRGQDVPPGVGADQQPPASSVSDEEVRAILNKFR